MRLKCLIILIVIFCTASCGGGDAELNKKTNSGKEISNMEASLYPVLFADRRKSSYIDVTSSARGVLGRNVLLGENKSKSFNAVALLMTEKHIVVFSESEILALSIDGKKLWVKEYWPGSPVSIFGDLVYYRKSDIINELGATFLAGGDIEKQMFVLNSSDNSFPFYIEPLKEDFIAVSFVHIGRSQGPSRFVVYRKPYEELEYAWVSEIEGPPTLLPLHIDELGRLVVFSRTEVIVYNPETEGDDGEEYKRFDNPVEDAKSCSADKEGLLYMLSGDETKLFLTAVSIEGETVWQWSTPMTEVNLPEIRAPIIGVDNKIHILTDDMVWTVKEGEKLWNIGGFGQIINFGTVLADGSLLIVAGSQLYRLDDKGEVLFRVILEDNITAPPVVDKDGNIYVVTANELVQII